MDPKSELSSAETEKRQASKRPWLVIGGLAALLMVAMLCLVAVAGIGGLLWLRTAQPATVAPPSTPAASDAPASVSAAASR